MRVAFFSPLPPGRSGISDYSAALIDALRPLADLEVFSGQNQLFDPSRFDIAVYQIGNNGYHGFVYEAALRHPGVVVMHESNLHHLIADLTIGRGDWEAYLDECEYNGGPAARAFAERVRRLEVGPDYEGLSMTRRLLEAARAVVVHSRFMERQVRAAGYAGSIAVIPHGAWIVDADRNGYRDKLGLDESTPLAGIFGFLKPYKRIPEALRAFRRLIAVAPDAKLILAGEPHPDLPLEPMIRSMRLEHCVRVLGFTAPVDFVGYLGACDVVLNLRYPTVGESSGTLLRAMGLGKPALVSDVGSFQELGDDVCLKVPVGAGEEDTIFEFLNLLFSRPEIARAVGAAAKEFVERECSWAAVARYYADFLRGVAEGKPVSNACLDRRPPAPAPPALAPGLPAYVRSWASTSESRSYIETHESRLLKTLEMIPSGGPCDRILEMGAYLQITPALSSKLGYGQVRGCYYGELGRTDRRVVTSSEGEAFACEIDHFDAEKDTFPYPDGHFTTVLCCELIEHLFEDPMHLMAEVNRILKPGGHLVLTTPNAASLRAISSVLQGYHPGFFPAYVRPRCAGTAGRAPTEPRAASERTACSVRGGRGSTGEETEARHNREYTPREIRLLLANSGFEIARLETGEFRELPHPEYGWVRRLLEQYRLETDLRGDGIYALARKAGPVRDRYPEWLYS